MKLGAHLSLVVGALGHREVVLHYFDDKVEVADRDAATAVLVEHSEEAGRNFDTIERVSQPPRPLLAGVKVKHLEKIVAKAVHEVRNCLILFNLLLDSIGIVEIQRAAVSI